MAEQLKVGVIGCAGRGGSFLNTFNIHPHTTLHALCDINEDGLVDLHDLVFIRDTLGYTSAAPSPSTATPEPATMTVLAIGGMLVLRRRRRKA